MNDLEMLKKLPDISFIDNKTIDDVLSELISDFTQKISELSGEQKELSLSDPYRLILYACAAQIYQMYQYIDRAGKQNTLKYSYGDFLDNMAAFKGVTRMAPKPSSVSMKITLSAARDESTIIPIGTKVSASGMIYFWELQEYCEIPAGQTTVTATFVCTTAGSGSNDLNPGEINQLVDLIPYVDSVVNVTSSSGGSEIEDDESLAERVCLAPAAYSTAGTEDAYIYWVKSFNPDISSVKVYSVHELDATVHILLMLKSGQPSEEFIKQLREYLEDVRPLTDKLVIATPEIVDYNIDVTYYISKDDQINAETIRTEVNNAVNDFIRTQGSAIGNDINTSLLIQKMMNAGARRVEIREPAYLVVDDYSVATNNPSSKTVLYGGVEND